MTGRELKQLLLDRGVKLNDVAQLLGLSPQALHHRLSVRSVKIDFVEKIEEVLGTELPIPRCNIPTTSGDHPAVALNNRVTPENNDVLQERVKRLEELLAEKERTIQILLAQMDQ